MTINHTLIELMANSSSQIIVASHLNPIYTSANTDVAAVDANGVVTAKAYGDTVIIVEDYASGYQENVAIRVHKLMSIQNTLPTYEIDPSKQIVIDREAGQYLGQPDSILLDDDQTIITIYPKGHGIGEAVLNKSFDGGLTWVGRTYANETWKDSRETPTIYNLDFNDGSQKIISISGGPGWGHDQFKGWKTSISMNLGETWSDYKEWYKGTETIVAMASLVKLKDNNGNWLNKWMGVYHDNSFTNYKTYLTFDEYGEEQWSAPESYLQPYQETESIVQLCEACIFRSPDGNQLILVARSQSHMHKSTISFSNDEGDSWSRPREVQGSLNGERHQVQYDPISNRIVITFREIILDYNNDSIIENDDWMAGNWVAWVGTYDDLVNGKEGQYRIILGEDFTPSRKSGDCGYAGNIVMKDGTFFLNSYGYFDKSEVERLGTDAKPYIMGVRFKLAEIDKKLNLV